MKILALSDAPAVITKHLRAINNFDIDGIIQTFSDDAYVNDNMREIRGIAAIRAFFAKEFIGDSVTVEPVEVLEHHGEIIIRNRYDGTYEKTNLPDLLVMTSYFAIHDGEITSLVIIFNQVSPYDGLNLAIGE
jgi:hypothetical protein